MERCGYLTLLFRTTFAHCQPKLMLPILNAERSIKCCLSFLQLPRATKQTIKSIHHILYIDHESKNSLFAKFVAFSILFDLCHLETGATLLAFRDFCLFVHKKFKSISRVILSRDVPAEYRPLINRETMSNETELQLQSLEEHIYEVSELIEDYVNDFVEKKEWFDPINNPITEFSEFKENNIVGAIKEEKNLVLELSSSRVLANFIDLKTSENDYNLRQTAALIDFSFYLRKEKESRFDLPHLLIAAIIRETSVDWLLKFWSFLDLRADLIKYGKDDELLQAHRFPGTTLIIALNLRLKQLEYNNETNRDFLKANILTLSSKIFPITDKYLMNKRFDFNQDIANKYILRNISQRRSLAYNAFWRLQPALANPIEELTSERAISDFMDNISKVYQTIYDIEASQHGPLQGAQSQPKDRTDDNTLETYNRANLIESKRDELRDFYSHKEFNPSFFINERRFKEQLEKDEFLRRTVLSQLFIFSCWVTNLSDSPEVQSNPKIANHKLKRFSRMIKVAHFLGLKKDIQYIFQSLDKKIFFVHQQLSLAEAKVLHLKLTQYKDFTRVYESLKVDDELYTKYDKIKGFRGRNFHEYGTPQISRHWKTATGLDLLAKDISKGTPDQMDQELERLRDSVKNSEDEDVKNLNSWKALRLARKNHLFKFKQINESTGLEGLFDPSLKEEYDKKKQVEDAKHQKEEEERQAKLKIEEEERKQEDLKRQEEEREELDKKRKASEEEFAEQSKRAKLESANGVKDAEDLDY